MNFDKCTTKRPWTDHPGPTFYFRYPNLNLHDRKQEVFKAPRLKERSEWWKFGSATTECKYKESFFLKIDINLDFSYITINSSVPLVMLMFESR